MSKTTKILKTKKVTISSQKQEPTRQIKETANYILATGKRKSAVAQVRLSLTGDQKIIVNNQDYRKYFPYFVWQEIIKSPLEAVSLKNYHLQIKVAGGGIRAQAESIKLGIAKAILKTNPELRKILKPKGFLSRDSRIKERKKPGLKRARRAPQWTKR